jgi:hypothetical protein
VSITFDCKHTLKEDLKYLKKAGWFLYLNVQSISGNASLVRATLVYLAVKVHGPGVKTGELLDPPCTV